MDTTLAYETLSKIVSPLNDIQGLLTLLLTTILVILNYKLAKETKHIREIESEPNIEVYLSPHEKSSSFINMAIKNNGRGTARNIKWAINYDEANAKDKGITIGKMSLFKVLHYLPASEHFLFYFGSSIKLLEEPKMKPIEIIVLYTNDKSSKSYKKSFIIDIEPWVGLTTIGTPPEYSIAKSISQIEKSIQHAFPIGKPPIFRIQHENEYRAERIREYDEFEQEFKSIREDKKAP
ncbi:hypothetical protein [Desulfovibrio psychrotolerans]|uniref:Uncharacterized protein n=1 Tax=Desulfovibrio psychrotolerans TaxID=415242 RepID=A0A7J0BQI3_9BACT|nr:hypothetical protein [Desulfovibrio psychrotolerans]GFM35930.1 hypothetical protein DSM19430T_06140 [Desulfovibrio psychrotolerans]